MYQFNSASGREAAVTVDKVEALEDGSGKVVVAYRFDGWESAAGFLEEELYASPAGPAQRYRMHTGPSVPDVSMLPSGFTVAPGLTCVTFPGQ